MIRIYCIDVSQINEAAYQRFYSTSTQERKQKADKYTDRSDAVRCIMAEALLKYALTDCGYSILPPIEKNKYGKPIFNSVNDLCFSISHSGDIVLVALSDKQIGVDVEQINRTTDRLGIANKFFSKAEYEYVFSSSDEQQRNERWTQIWTLKESYIKYIGQGLSKRLNTFEVSFSQNGILLTDNGKILDRIYMNSFMLEKEYAVAVCGEYNDFELKRIALYEL